MNFIHNVKGKVAIITIKKSYFIDFENGNHIYTQNQSYFIFRV